eukprot:TRINITY_DN924_c0_g1_i17.p2 TRINITY_DN924_c0_g1~~TRINITY_DN924_c0_g1_i17.p2  ORF type:complete len:274 (+),score=60.60 TRINITY_DN924_c0_g1_i17:1360-2181(+)
MHAVVKTGEDEQGAAKTGENAMQAEAEQDKVAQEGESMQAVVKTGEGEQGAAKTGEDAMQAEAEQDKVAQEGESMQAVAKTGEGEQCAAKTGENAMQAEAPQGVGEPAPHSSPLAPPISPLGRRKRGRTIVRAEDREHKSLAREFEAIGSDAQLGPRKRRKRDTEQDKVAQEGESMQAVVKTGEGEQGAAKTGEDAMQAKERKNRAKEASGAVSVSPPSQYMSRVTSRGQGASITRPNGVLLSGRSFVRTTSPLTHNVHKDIGRLCSHLLHPL